MPSEYDTIQSHKNVGKVWQISLKCYKWIFNSVILLYYETLNKFLWWNCDKLPCCVGMVCWCLEELRMKLRSQKHQKTWPSQMFTFQCMWVSTIYSQQIFHLLWSTSSLQPHATNFQTTTNMRQTDQTTDLTMICHFN